MFLCLPWRYGLSGFSGFFRNFEHKVVWNGGISFILTIMIIIMLDKLDKAHVEPQECLDRNFTPACASKPQLAS